MRAMRIKISLPNAEVQPLKKIRAEKVWFHLRNFATIANRPRLFSQSNKLSSVGKRRCKRQIFWLIVILSRPCNDLSVVLRRVRNGLCIIIIIIIIIKYLPLKLSYHMTRCTLSTNREKYDRRFEPPSWTAIIWALHFASILVINYLSSGVSNVLYNRSRIF